MGVGFNSVDGVVAKSSWSSIDYERVARRCIYISDPGLPKFDEDLAAYDQGGAGVILKD